MTNTQVIDRMTKALLEEGMDWGFKIVAIGTKNFLVSPKVEDGFNLEEELDYGI